MRDWSLALALLILYFYSREMADNLGMTVRYSEPIEVDKWLGFGDTPSARLQSVLCGSPCDPSSTAHWYDRAFIIVWMSHFTVGLGVAVILWLRNRLEFKKWMRRYLALNFAALLSYVLIPTAPPWMASADGRLPSEVLRLSARAWLGPRPEGVGGADPAAWAGNAVAAMPSLHAAVAFLVAMYAVERFSSRWRWLFMLYPLTMSFALVYLGEHYVTDVLAGAACAAAVLAASTAWERSRGRRTVQSTAQDPGRGDSLIRRSGPRLLGENDAVPSELSQSRGAVVRQRAWLLPACLVVGVFVVFALTARHGGGSWDYWTANYASWHLVHTGSPFIDGVHIEDLTGTPEAGTWIKEAANGHIVISRFPGVVAIGLPAYAIVRPDSMTVVPGAHHRRRRLRAGGADDVLRASPLRELDPRLRGLPDARVCHPHLEYLRRRGVAAHCHRARDRRDGLGRGHRPLVACRGSSVGSRCGVGCMLRSSLRSSASSSVCAAATRASSWSSGRPVRCSSPYYACGPAGCTARGTPRPLTAPACSASARAEVCRSPTSSACGWRRTAASLSGPRCSSSSPPP